MSSELRLRRGNQVSHDGFVGGIGEVTYNTDTKALHVHDGTTAGGFAGGGYKAPFAGASVRTQRDKNAESVSVKDFGAKGDGIADDTAAIQAAINATDVYDVFFPDGTYLHSGLYCDKNNFRIHANGYARAILKSDNSPHVALHIAKNVAGISGFFMSGIKLLGNVNTLRGVQLGDTTKYVQFCCIADSMIDGFTKLDASDIHLGSVQELEIYNVMSWRGNIGVYKAAGGYGTSVKIAGKAGYLGRHNKHAIKLDGQIDDIYVQDSVIEGNGLEAVYIADTAFKSTQGVTIYLQNAYFEENGKTGGNGVIYAKGTNTYLKLHRVYVSGCNFAANPSAGGGFKNIAGEYTIFDIAGSNVLPSAIGVTNCLINYHGNQTVSSANIFQQLRDLSLATGNNLMASGFDYLNTGIPSQNSQANFLSAVTFPALAALSTDPSTLDDYREVSDFVPVCTGNGGTVSEITCRYTKIGNLVSFTIQMTTANFTSTADTTKVTLPHDLVIAAAAQFCNLQTLAGGSCILASQAVNLPTLPSQGSVATIFITGTYMTVS